MSQQPSEPLPPPPPAGPPTIPRPYREDLRVSWWMWLLGAGFALTTSIAFIPVSPRAGLAGLLVGGALAVWGIVRWTLVIEVKDGVLRVDRARVPVSLLGEVRSLDEAAMRVERGPRLDARAFLALRGWAGTGVRISLCDPDDPTPYWLVSTRHPEELAAALTATTADSAKN